jgi:hypothetical protein
VKHEACGGDEGSLRLAVTNLMNREETITEDKSSADTAQTGPDPPGLVLEKEFGTAEWL